jgi:RNA polymerase sigma factor (sigma-70 family)
MSGQPVASARIDELLAQLQHELDITRLPPAAAVRAFVVRHHLGRDQLEALTSMLGQRRQSAGRHEKHVVSDEPSVSASAQYIARHANDPDEAQPDSPPAPSLEALELPGEGEPIEYDEFGLPVSAPLAVARPVAGDVTERCVSDLMDDWQRQGALSLTDIHRAADRLGLGASQIAQVVSRLESVGAYDADAPDGGGRELVDLDDSSYAGADSVRAYLLEVGRYRLLRAEEEVQLGRRIRAGQQATAELEASASVDDPEYLRRLVTDGHDAHSVLVCANLRLAVNMARHPRYRASSVEFLDRVQFGNLGLIRAAQKYDFSLGFKFSTYATWWIRQSMERGIADEGRLIRLPVHMVEKLNRLKRIRAELSETLNHPATVRELAEHLGEDPGAVAALLDSERLVTSLDAGRGEDGSDDFTLMDVVEDGFLDVDPADQVIGALSTAQMHKLLIGLLTDREYKIVTQRFGLVDGGKRTLDEIGADLGVTRERVRQVQNKVLTRLRGPAGQAIRELISIDGLATVRSAQKEDASVKIDGDTPASDVEGPPAEIIEEEAS